jgi:hypothetical protein
MINKHGNAHYLQARFPATTMTLRVTFTETNRVIGQFNLERAKTPEMHRCY